MEDGSQDNYSWFADTVLEDVAKALAEKLPTSPKLSVEPVVVDKAADGTISHERVSTHLTTDQSEACPQADHALFGPLL